MVTPPPFVCWACVTLALVKCLVHEVTAVYFKTALAYELSHTPLPCRILAAIAFKFDFLQNPYQNPRLKLLKNRKMSNSHLTALMQNLIKTKYYINS